MILIRLTALFKNKIYTPSPARLRHCPRTPTPTNPQSRQAVEVSDAGIPGRLPILRARVKTNWA